jgi:hypothetical protein
MKKQFIHKAFVAFQVLVLTCIVAFAAFGLLSFKIANYATRYADVWQILGTDQRSGTYNIKESFLGGYIQYGGARNLRSIATGDRAAVAKDLLAYTKQYVGSDAFTKEYNGLREGLKPQQPALAKTEEQIRKENIESSRKGIESLEKAMKTAEGEMKRSFQSTIETMKENIKTFEDPNSEMVKMFVQGEKSQYEYRMKDYQEQMKKWEAHYPANVKGFVKVRLQQVLNATKEVDFNAQLTERNGRKYFVKPEYEKKHENWKMAFRAGKEVTAEVRAFAQQWLTEVQ